MLQQVPFLGLQTVACRGGEHSCAASVVCFETAGSLVVTSPVCTLLICYAEAGSGMVGAFCRLFVLPLNPCMGFGRLCSTATCKWLTVPRSPCKLFPLAFMQSTLQRQAVGGWASHCAFLPAAPSAQL